MAEVPIKNVGAAIANSSSTGSKWSKMDIMATVNRIGELKKALKILIIVIIVGLVIWGLIALYKYTVEQYEKTSSPKHNVIILKDRLNQLSAPYEQRKDKIRGYEEAAKLVGQDEQALANFRVLTTNIAGYMGPLVNGVFSEKDAVTRAFELGVRHFVLPIDYLDERPDVPRIVVRDVGGWLKSNNTGSIEQVVQGILDMRKRNNDPILLTLYFYRLPGEGAASNEALNFMSSVARSLQPIASYHIGITTEGDYRRQGMADSLFMKNIDTYARKVIIMTNVDTAGFRRPDVHYKPVEDLDLWTHLRIFTEESPSSFNVNIPDKTIATYGVLNSLAYYSQIPKDQETAVSDKTRLKFTIAFDYSPIELPQAYAVKNAAALGVQSVAYDVFTDVAENGAALTTALGFTANGFVLKDAPLRFKKLAPVVAATPPSEINANGGSIPSPK